MSTPEFNSDTRVDNTDNSGTQTTPETAVNWEKRYKDTQAAFTKKAQEVAALKAKLKVLEDTVKPTTPIPSDKQQELEDLKYSDPDAWRAEMNKLEEAYKSDLNKKIEATANELTELERRELVLQDFYARHPGFVLDDQYVPPIIANKLAKGEITFEQFLSETYEFLNKPRKIATGNKPLNQPNLSKVGGGDTPDANAIKLDIVTSYKSEIY